MIPPRRFLTTVFTVLLACISLPSVQAQAFRHPGVRHSQGDLALMKSRVLANQQPWKATYDSMVAWRGHDGSGRAAGSLSFTPNPFPIINVGLFESPKTGQDEGMTDATAAYIHAIQWYVTKNPAHAEKTLQICNAWATTLTSIEGANKELAASWIGEPFCEAAEIVKSTYYGAPAGAWTAFDNMLRTKFYPVIENFKPTFNGNWDALCLSTMMAIGIVIDDRAIYNRGKNYYLTGAGNGSLPGYVRLDGTTQETTRDQRHEQMGVLALVNAAEMAWKQGEDIYSALGNRLLIGLEGTAGRVDDQNFKAYPGWDIAYNHYKNRKGLPTPKMDAFKGTSHWGGDDWSYNTVGMWTLLTFRDLGNTSGPATVIPPTFTPPGGAYSSAPSVTLSTSTSGASIRYTLDGSTPSTTVGTLYTAPFTVSGPATVKAIGYKAGFMPSWVSTADYTFIAPVTSMVRTAGAGWDNSSMANQTGTFTVTFDAKPSNSPTNALVGLSRGTQTAFSGFAAVVRFNTLGRIDARNGGAYAAASVIPFTANTNYSFRLVVNVPAHTYSIFVTPAGGSELTVGTNYAFRTEQNTVPNLDNWGAVVDAAGSGGVGTLTVQNFAIGGLPPALPLTPAFSPAPGTYSAAQSVNITSSGATTIRYTTDGSTPTAASTLYSGAIAVSANTTIKAIGLNGAGSSPVAIGAYTITGSGTSVTLSPIADTYGFGGATTTNFGAALVLGAKDDGAASTSFDRIAYIKFDLSGLAFTPTSASLVLTTDATTQAGTLTANQCTTDSWTEAGLTWENQPAVGAPMGSAPIVAGLVVDLTLDVSSYVNSEFTSDATKIVTIALTGNNAQLYLKSRETGAADAPSLVVGN